MFMTESDDRKALVASHYGGSCSFDDYFAKTGNIALSNDPKISQRPVLDD